MELLLRCANETFVLEHAAAMATKRIPLRGGDEYDALTKAKRVHIWRAGDRAKIKRRYWKRFRRQPLGD
ncbi:hypothetical protein [Roseomonas elaeocarpi]|uniref:Uncharacterized protein n=1 Tax=Roseomonas elaeocarpi TaxID=907779 RepID=A0ABV6JRE6_9PROT